MRTIMLLLLASCAPDLRTLNRFRIVGAEFVDGNHFISEDNGDGSMSAQVKADDKVLWIYVDLETGVEVTEADPWDLAFQRFKVRTHDTAAVLPETQFADVMTLPAAEWQTDGEGDDLVFNRGDGWYFYNLSNHTLVARQTVYVVETPEGGHFKVQMLNYYDATGSSAFPSFKYAALP